MKIEILDYIPDKRGFRTAFVDIKIAYTQEKYEIIRNLSYFEKDNRKWLSHYNVKRNDLWLPIYQRSPDNSKEIFTTALAELKSYLKNYA